MKKRTQEVVNKLHEDIIFLWMATRDGFDEKENFANFITAISMSFAHVLKDYNVPAYKIDGLVVDHGRAIKEFYRLFSKEKERIYEQEN
jgi:hypothetical protein